MGTFGGLKGKVSIPEEKAAEFSALMDKVLYFGGMMHINSAEMYGMRVTLLEPVHVKEGENIEFHYSYFESNSWESAGYDDSRNRLWSNKIGSSEFCDVITAANVLYELYSKTPVLAEIDGDTVDPVFYVQWLSHLAGKDYTIAHRYRIWDNLKASAYSRYHDTYDADEVGDVFDLIPKRQLKYAGGTELADALYVANGGYENGLAEEADGGYAADREALKEAVESFMKKDAKGFARIMELVAADYRKRASAEGDIRQVAQMSLYMPARMLVYFACMAEKREFFEAWFEMEERAYKDENQKAYAGEDLEAFRKEGQNMSVQRIGTSRFLRQDGFFTFYDTPEPLKGKPKYYLSDADRLYWWDGTDEVVIDEKTESWLKEEKKLLQEKIASCAPHHKEESNPIKDLMQLLIDIEERYQRVFAFSSMFYEFIEHSSQPEYRAAISLLRDLYEENADEGSVIEHRGIYWDLTSRNVTWNEGRRTMLRYLSLLANKKLRKIYLGF